MKRKTFEEDVCPTACWSAIRLEVCEKGFDPEQMTFTQAYRARGRDASVLVMLSVRGLPANDLRVKGTIVAIGRELMRDGFVARCDTRRPPTGEGAFFTCIFWYADNLALQGRKRRPPRSSTNCWCGVMT